MTFIKLCDILFMIFTIETRFAKCLNMTLLEEVDSGIEGALAYLRSGTRNIKMPVPEYQQMITVTNSIVSDPSSNALPSQVAASWKSLDRMTKATEVDVQATCISRAQVMGTNAAMWLWLFDACVGPAYDLLRQGEKPGSTPDDITCGAWVKKLVIDVSSGLTRRTSFTLIPADYVTGLIAKPFEYRHARNSPYLSSMEARTQMAGDVVQEAVQFWLNFPTNPTSQAQAIFIYHICRRFSTEDILLLDCTWKTYRNLKARLTVEKTDVAKLNWNEISYSFTSHPLSDIASTETQLLRRIGRKFHEFEALTQQTSTHHPMVPLQTTPALLSTFVEMLKVSIAVIDCPSELFRPGRVEAQMMSNLDWYLPLREFQTSRKIVKEHPDGPFSSKRLRTREGFFSALVFRTITQGAPIITEDQVVLFKSDVDFMKRLGGREEGYACHMDAHGTTYPCHTTDNAPKLWRNSTQWAGFLDANHDRSFMRLWDFLRSRNQGAEHQNPPGLDDMTAYLLAADYAYTAVVNFPTVDEVGAIIFALNAGGVKGLQLLQMVGLHPTKDQCIQAFRSLWGFVQGCLTDQEREAMQFDVVLMEDALVKAPRLDREVGLFCAQVHTMVIPPSIVY